MSSENAHPKAKVLLCSRIGGEEFDELSELWLCSRLRLLAQQSQEEIERVLRLCDQ